VLDTGGCGSAELMASVDCKISETRHAPRRHDPDDAVNAAP
jgi:hypothetical protein